MQVGAKASVGPPMHAATISLRSARRKGPDQDEGFFRGPSVTERLDPIEWFTRRIDPVHWYLVVQP